MASGLRSVSPRAGRGLLFGSLVISVVVVAFSAPLLFGWGAQPDNPSFLPRNYAFGVAVVLAVVWGLAALRLLGRRTGVVMSDRRGIATVRDRPTGQGATPEAVARPDRPRSHAGVLERQTRRATVAALGVGLGAVGVVHAWGRWLQ